MVVNDAICCEGSLNLLIQQQAPYSAKFDVPPVRRIHPDIRFLPEERDKLLDYVEANLDAPLRIRNLADVVDRTPHQLVDACHEAFGVTPAKLVMRQRLSRARELLANPKTTITEVAMAVGFSSPSHFTRAFQRYYQTTPRQFRSEL